MVQRGLARRRWLCSSSTSRTVLLAAVRAAEGMFLVADSACLGTELAAEKEPVFVVVALVVIAAMVVSAVACLLVHR